LEAIVALKTVGLTEQLISVVAQSGERSLDLQAPKFLYLRYIEALPDCCIVQLCFTQHQAVIAQYNTAALFSKHELQSHCNHVATNYEFTSTAMKHKYIGNQLLC
jgi:hypothetical protein